MITSIRTNAGAMIALQMLAGGERARVEAYMREPIRRRVEPPEAQTFVSAYARQPNANLGDADRQRIERAEAKRARKLAKNARPA